VVRAHNDVVGNLVGNVDVSEMFAQDRDGGNLDEDASSYVPVNEMSVTSRAHSVAAISCMSGLSVLQQNYCDTSSFTTLTENSL
jgi:hypothetical protein